MVFFVLHHHLCFKASHSELPHGNVGPVVLRSKSQSGSEWDQTGPQITQIRDWGLNGLVSCLMESVTPPETTFSKSKVLTTAQISTKRSSLVEVPPLLICRLVIHTTGGKWRHGAKSNLNKGRNRRN